MTETPDTVERRRAEPPGAPPDAARLAHDERADLADFLDTLRPEQWDAPTLCTRWSVRDVVAHVISFEDLDRTALVTQFVRARLRPDRVNDLLLAGLRDLPPRELVARVRQHLDPRGLTAGFGGRIALVDGLVHHQDVRRALGMPRVVPAERLRVALPFARLAPPIGAWWRARGLRLVATDLDWTAGRGPEVRGPAEPLLMAIAGRRGTTTELSGPGADVLSARTGG